MPQVTERENDKKQYRGGRYKITVTGNRHTSKPKFLLIYSTRKGASKKSPTPNMGCQSPDKGHRMLPTVDSKLIRGQ